MIIIEHTFAARLLCNLIQTIAHYPIVVPINSMYQCINTTSTISFPFSNYTTSTTTIPFSNNTTSTTTIPFSNNTTSTTTIRINNTTTSTTIIPNSYNSKPKNKKNQNIKGSNIMVNYIVSRNILDITCKRWTYYRQTYAMSNHSYIPSHLNMIFGPIKFLFYQSLSIGIGVTWVYSKRN